jgi:hypothetical protein
MSITFLVFSNYYKEAVSKSGILRQLQNPLENNPPAGIIDSMTTVSSLTFHAFRRSQLHQVPGRF